MTIYALFLCVQTLGTCQMQGQARVTFAGIMPAMTFNSLMECQRFAKRMTGVVLMPTDGRFFIDPNNMNVWYECRSRHVDTWEPTQ